MMDDVFVIQFSLILGGSILLGLAGYAVSRLEQRSDGSTTAAFLGVALSGAIWSFAYALEFEAHGAAGIGTITWAKIAFSGTILMAISWPLFVLYFTKPEFTGQWPVPVALSIIPGVTLIALWTNGIHHLLFTRMEFTTVDEATVLQPVLGPIAWAFLVYTYAIALVVVYLLVRDLIDTTGVRRRQVILLLAAGVIPLSVRLAGTLNLLGSAPIDYTPVVFTVTAPLVGWALFKHQLLDLVPGAYQQILAEMDDGLVVLDAADRIVNLNATGEKILDASKRTAVGMPIQEFVDAHPAAELAVLLDSETEATGIEIVLEDEEGPTIYDVRLSRLKATSDNAADGTILVFRNVTDKRTAQRQFRALVENTSNLVTVLAPDGSAMYISPRMEELLGHSPTDLLGENLFELIHPDDRKETFAAFDRCQSVGHARAEYHVQHEDGSWRRFESVAESFVDDPVLGGVVVTSWDVTAQRNYEQRLQVQNRVLRHDLRNDVNVIHGNAGLLLNDLEGTPHADRIETIRRKAADLDALGECARTIDRILHNDRGVATADLIEILSKRIDRAESEYPRATFDVFLDDMLSVAVTSRVDTVFDELLANAVEHNDQVEPHVQVWTSGHELNGVEYANVHVADDGPGIGRMTKKVLESEVETQLEHSPGLGLWLVRWIVESFQGILDIARLQPRGTVVTVTVPRAGPPTDSIENRIPFDSRIPSLDD